jgi:hypothetical protein
MLTLILNQIQLMSNVFFTLNSIIQESQNMTKSGGGRGGAGHYVMFR